MKLWSTNPKIALLDLNVTQAFKSSQSFLFIFNPYGNVKKFLFAGHQTTYKSEVTKCTNKCTMSYNDILTWHQYIKWNEQSCCVCMLNQLNKIQNNVNVLFSITITNLCVWHFFGQLVQLYWIALDSTRKKLVEFVFIKHYSA